MNVPLDEIAKNPENGDVMKQAFYIFILSLALIGMFGQSTANAVDRFDCGPITIGQETSVGNKPEICCSSDCTGMLQCSQTSLIFDENMLPLKSCSIKILRPFTALIQAPAGRLGVPVTKPPIAA